MQNVNQWNGVDYIICIVHDMGTEASAATAFVFETYGAAPGRQKPIIEFVANRPFLFFLWDRQTKTLLFNGRFVG